MAWLDAAPSFERLLTVELWLAALYAMYAGTLVPLLTEIIPGKARSSGYSIILSLANGIFGSFTPFIATVPDRGDRRPRVARPLALGLRGAQPLGQPRAVALSW